MLIGRAIDVDDDDLSTFAQRGPQPPKKGIGLAHLVVHVNHEHAVEAVLGQPRIVLNPQLDRDIVKAFIFDAGAEPPEGILVDVLGENAPFGTYPLGQPYGVITLARADVCYGHARLNSGQIHHRGGLVPVVARLLGRHRVLAQIGNRSVGPGKLACSCGAIEICLRPTLAAGQGERRDEDEAQPQSTSSTSTVSPVTRCASAAAMKSSISSSRTSSGLLEVTPVRRSFTIWYGCRT